MSRPTDARDLAPIAELYHRVWHETHRPHMPQAERDARQECFFLNRMTGLMPNVVVCEAGSAIVGFAAWKGSRLGQLFLDASARESGFAQRLMEAAERRLRGQRSRKPSCVASSAMNARDGSTNAPAGTSRGLLPRRSGVRRTVNGATSG
ncbi:hypothetical protein DK412_05865 [Methylobacterium sp. 17Sr1-1]|nr:hypothetical protein DK412_05865 [Methylobacterium sp. 17Sr1-1]